MEINWIVTIYWLMEAGKGYRFIRYIYCYNQIMAQMEMSKPWSMHFKFFFLNFQQASLKRRFYLSLKRRLMVISVAWSTVFQAFM